MVIAGDILPDAGLPSDLESRHQERGVRGLWIETARTQQARDHVAGRGRHRIGNLECRR